MEILLLSVAQLAIGLIIAITITIGVVFVWEYFGLHKTGVHTMYDFEADKAEIRREGAWQYNDDYLDKITEFRNDFTGR